MPVGFAVALPSRPRPLIGIGVKRSLKFLCVDLPVFTHDMCIDFRDHVDLCVVDISLGGFPIPFVQLQLVGRAGVAQGMEYHFNVFMYHKT